LKRGDYDKLGKAIEDERKIIEQLVPAPALKSKRRR